MVRTMKYIIFAVVITIVPIVTSNQIVDLTTNNLKDENIEAGKCLDCGMNSLLNGNTSNLIVKTEHGIIEGFQLLVQGGQSVNAFYGIPYAAPPIGKQRFKPPVDVKPWTGTLKTQKKTDACIQVILKGYFTFKSPSDWFVARNIPTSEDCLYLNVWSPSSTSKKVPVIIWIHGGMFLAGSAMMEKYDGAVLAAKNNVIVVSMNYRMSVFGFIYSEQAGWPGNVGLMDQAKAFEWVQRNIKKFGGDPNRVTIVGGPEGVSAELHFFIPSSQNLFQRAIFQSGAINSMYGPATINMTVYYTQLLAQATNCSSVSQIETINFDCLRQLSAEKLAATASSINEKFFLAFKPTIDGNYIPNKTFNMTDPQKRNQSIDIMLGSTTQNAVDILEMLNILPNEEFCPVNSTYFHEIIAKYGTLGINKSLVDLTQWLYTNYENPNDQNIIREELVKYMTDGVITCPMILLADYMSSTGNNVYWYEFGQRPSISRYPTWAGTVHGDDVDFFFGTPLNISKGYTDDEMQLSIQMMTYFSNFAHTGNPTPNGNTWQKYTANEQNFRFLALNSNYRKGIRQKHCVYWQKIILELIQIFAKM